MAVKAMRIQRLTKDAKENLLEDLLKRSPNNYGQYEQGVQEILAHVKEEKDQAVFAYTKKFDHADITADNIKVTEEEIEEAYKEVDPKLVEIIALTAILSFYFLSVCTVLYLLPQSCQQVFDPCAFHTHTDRIHDHPSRQRTYFLQHFQTIFTEG